MYLVSLENACLDEVFADRTYYIEKISTVTESAMVLYSSVDGFLILSKDRTKGTFQKKSITKERRMVE